MAATKSKKKNTALRASDLELFKTLCKEIDPELYGRYTSSDEEFKESIESGEYFERFKKNPCFDKVLIDFEELAQKLGVKSLRYYQKLAVFFSRFYLFNKYSYNRNKFKNGVAYWMATGSGKTLILQADILSYLEFIKEKYPTCEQVEIIVTSSLAELISQLEREIEGFYQRNREFLDRFGVKFVIETIQSLMNKKEEFEKDIPDNYFRLVLFDEAHVGLASNKVGAFKEMRDLLVKNRDRSFLFEYSATFNNLNKELFEEYKKKIIFDYSYAKFFGDLYGKDFVFQKIKKDVVNEEKEIEPNVKENLKLFKEKLEAYEFVKEHTSYKFEDRPLLVVVGNTTVGSKEEKKENSDILKFLRVLNDLSDTEKRNYSLIFNGGTGRLTFIDNKDKEDEILVAFGAESTPFGLINIGGKEDFLKKARELFGEEAVIEKTFLPREWSFEHIDSSNCPVNILMGSRKFSMGWNSYRVSQICLINFGKSKGNTVIQIFGRGVRLKGYKGDGKRLIKHYVKEDKCAKDEFISYRNNKKVIEASDRAKKVIKNEDIYKKIQLLETLAIFSLKRSYLETFVRELPICEKIHEHSIEVKCFDNLELFKVNGNYLPFLVVKTSESISVDEKDYLIVSFEGQRIVYRFKKCGERGEIGDSLEINLSVEEKKSVCFSSLRYLDLIDSLRLEERLLEVLRENKIILTESLMQSSDVARRIADILDRFAEVYYDGEIKNPVQAEALLVKAFRLFLNKLRKRILSRYRRVEHKLDFLRKDEVLKEFTVRVVFDGDADDELSKQASEEITSLLKFYFPVAFCNPSLIDPENRAKETVKLLRDEEELEIKNNYLEDVIKGKVEKFADLNLNRIEISPDKLNLFEMKFISDVQRWVEENNAKVSLYRIVGKGEIFFPVGSEGDRFFPDFVMKWVDEDNKVIHIAFIDPKGLVHYARDKVFLSSKIKELEKKLEDIDYLSDYLKVPDKYKLKLHSLIITHTKPENIDWLRDELEELKKVERKKEEEILRDFYNIVLFTKDKSYLKNVLKIIKRDDEDYNKLIDFQNKSSILGVKFFSMEESIKRENSEEYERCLLKAERILKKKGKKSRDTVEEMARIVLATYFFYEKKENNKTKLREKAKEIANMVPPKARNMIKNTLKKVGDELERKGIEAGIEFFLGYLAGKLY